MNQRVRLGVGNPTHSSGARRWQSCVNQVRRGQRPAGPHFETRVRQQHGRCDIDAGVEMSFMNSNGLDDLAKRLADSVPESLRAFGRDLEGNFKAVLQAQLAKLDLVTRQDFDVQAAILERTQAKLTAIEARLKELETKLSPP
jgi:ubiquinone biosynthesis accessory factor UbiK